MTPRQLCPLALALGMAAAAAPHSAHAHSAIDSIEHLLGASNVHAITGHGRLTLGVSRDGDLSVMVWPNPSYTDQLGYMSSNAWDARDLPRLGAPEGAGVVLGLLVETADGAAPFVTWLRDRTAWTSTQSYGPLDGASVVTAFTHEDLDLSVEVVDAVAPAEVDAASDHMVRHVTVTRGPSSTVTALWLLTYANLSPTPRESRLPQLPLADWGMDGRNDFAAVWDASAQTIVHFHPGDQKVFSAIASVLLPPAVDYGPIGAALAAGGAVDAQALADTLDADYSPGTYLALTTSPAPDQHQVGFDETDFCGKLDEIIDNAKASVEGPGGIPLPVDASLLENVRCGDAEPPWVSEGWEGPREDAWSDAADGELSGSDLAAGEINTALRTPLVFDADVATASVVIGAGPTAADARAAAEAGAADPVAVWDAAEQALSGWLAERRLPKNPNPRVERVARRSLINVRVGTVADNGAIVASITRQPPYGLDWPRDGAFFNVALDAAGWTDLAEQRVDLYIDWQRKEPADPTPLIDLEPPPDPDTGSTATYPAAAWEMNYYADGMNGGTFRFEIDNAGFALWMIVAHVGWVPAAERQAWLQARWAPIKATADLLARWRDPDNGLPAPAQEDDNAIYTQTMHGAVTTFGALDIAARAARLIGEDADAGAWEARAEELRDAILAEFWVSSEEGFNAEESETPNPGSTGLGPKAWMVWPTHTLPWDDARVDVQLAIDIEQIRPIIELETEGGAYFLKNMVTLALARGNDPEIGPDVQDLLVKIADHATATDHFGEVMVVVDEAGEKRASQRVSTPHLWEGTLFYLTALAAEDPSALLAYDSALPASRVSAPPPLEGAPDPAPEAAPDAGPELQAEAAPDEPSVDATSAEPSAPGSETDEGCSCQGGSPARALWPALVLSWLMVRRRE